MAVTLRDVAQRLNLSHATVSFVLNDRRDVTIPETTRQRVMDAAREMGYRPNRAARALVMGRTQIIAVFMHSAAHPFYAAVLDAVHGASQELGYEILFCQGCSRRGGREAFDWPVDGVLAVDGGTALTEGMLPPSLPVAAVGTWNPPSRDEVLVDLLPGAVEAMMHLVDSGRHRIAFVTQDCTDENPRDRSAAYHSICYSAGLKPEIILCPGNHQSAAREVVANHLRHHGQPDALLCFNDLLAIAALRGVADLGLRVPQDIAIVGHDGIAATEYMIPSLSTVELPVAQMCRTGMEFLVNRIKEPDMPDQRATMTGKLIVRESSQSHWIG